MVVVVLAVAAIAGDDLCRAIFRGLVVALYGFDWLG